jgi:peptide/nickel transport system substrate-binding protein
MQNRFGFKDFVLLLVMGLTLLFVLLNMTQEDRRFGDTKMLMQKIEDVERSVSQLRRQVESGGGSADVDALMAALSQLPGGTDSKGRVGSRDESWARPDVPVVWPNPWGPVHMPQGEPNFAEGGTLTETFEAKMTKLTPYVYSDVYGRRIVDEIVCEQLANYNPETLRLEGWLADAWQIDPEGLWIRVRINPKARFSDGLPVTAEDVRYTFMDFIMNDAIEAQRTRSTMPQLKDVVVISDRVVEFQFSEANFFNTTIALRSAILPKHYYSQFTPTQINQATSLLMGSGPYRLASNDINDQWKPGTPLTLVRNERYWGTRPPIDRLRFDTIDDNVARLTAFENGMTDIIRATPEQYAAKERDPGFAKIGTLHSWENMRSGYSFIGWNCGERNGKPTPFADVRVRRAMTMLLDRERISRDFYEGLASVATGPFSPSTEQCNGDIQPLEYNIEKARQLLNEAGWLDRNNDGFLANERGDRFVFKFTYSTGSSLAARVGQYLADQCARVGIRCELEIVEWAILIEKLDTRDFDAVTLAWSWSAPESDPRQVWHSDSIRNQGDNFVQYSNPLADELIDKARTTIDFDERQKLWKQLHTVIHEDQPYTFLLNTPWIRFVSVKVGNFREYPVGMDKYSMFKMQP